MHKNTKKGFVPSPLFSDIWGATADTKLSRSGKKKVITADVRHGHKKHKGDTVIEKCPCKGFKEADARYHAMTPAERAPWQAAVKKPVLSGYSLFMKEALATILRHNKWPECPSVSGGYSCRHLELGEEYAPEDWVGMAPPISRYDCTGPPSWECVPNPDGVYPSLAACLADCKPPTWHCAGDPTWECILAPGGEHATLIDCLLACIYDPPIWIGYDCYSCLVDTTPCYLSMYVHGLTGLAAEYNGRRFAVQSEEDDCIYLWWIEEAMWGVNNRPEHQHAHMNFAGNLIEWQLPLESPRNCLDVQSLPFLRGYGIFEHQESSWCITSPWNKPPWY
ncbi:hypothetical protein ES705_29340 [subsurface metagenome]